MPDAHAELLGILRTLEAHYKDMQDLEFTVEDEELYMLQCRVGKRTATAAVRTAIDMVKDRAFDLVFLDPPFGARLHEPALRAARRSSDPAAIACS